MILFLEDWYRYDAIANVHTDNQSFVHMARLYKAMGIKNHMFMLALHNKNLVGINPFDDTLSQTEMGMIVAECKINPWFFFREIARVPPQSGVEPVRLIANRGNMALYWSFFNHILITLVQIRQTGKSVSSDVLADYLAEVKCTSTNINLLTLNDGLRAKNLERLKEISDLLPFYLKKRTKMDINNSEEFSVKELDNSYRGHLPQKQQKMANTVGRGLTSPIFFGDEGPFQPNFHISLKAALAAGTAARDEARRKNEPYGTILTTTAGKKDTPEGAYFFDLINGSAEWTEAFFDAKNHAELERIVRTNSRKHMFRVNVTLNHRQLGKTDEWLMQAIEDADVSGEEADRDFFNRWTAGGAMSPLSVELMEMIRASECDPSFPETRKRYVLKWFIPENEIKATMRYDSFVMALDTSDASGGDDISLRLTSASTGETIAVGNYNETNLIEFAEWIADLLTEYSNVLLIPERRSSAAAVIDFLLLILPARGIDPFRRIFNRVVHDKNESEETGRRFEQIIGTPLGRRHPEIYTENKKLFGFATSATGEFSRTNLYSSVLRNAAKNIGDKVKDKMTIDQILALEIRNGRVDHRPGEHDDMVISWLLSYWLLTNGRNLHVYGLQPGNVLRTVKQKAFESEDAAYEYQEQVQLRKQITDLAEKLKTENDQWIIAKYEQQLRNLSMNLKQINTEEKLSVEQLIESIREEKKRTISARRYQQNLSSNNSSGFNRYNTNYLAANVYRDPMAFHL